MMHAVRKAGIPDYLEPITLKPFMLFKTIAYLQQFVRRDACLFHQAISTGLELI